MKEQDDIDHLFRSEFDDFAVAPPASVKEAVDLSIAVARNRFFKRWFYAGLVLFVILFVAGVSLFATAEREQKIAKTNTTENVGSVDNKDDSELGNNEAQNATKQVEQSTFKSDSLNLPKAEKKDSEIKNAVNQNQTEQVLGKKTKSATKSERENQNVLHSQKTESGKLFSTSNGGSEKAKFSPQKSSNKEAKRKKDDEVSKSTAGQNIFATSRDEKNTVPADPKTESPTDVKKESEPSSAVVTQSEKQAELKMETQAEKSNLKEPLSAEKQPEKPSLKDSLTPYVEDSLSPFAKIPEVKKNRERTLLFSLKPGASIGFNNRKDTISQMLLKEKSSFYMQGEASYFFSPKMAISSGLNYEFRNDLLTKNNITTTDSVIVGYNNEVIFDSLQNPVDTIEVPIYSTESSSASLQNSYRLYAIGLPVFFTYSQALSEKLNLDLSAGAILSLQGRKILSENFTQSSVENKFGVKACLRAQLRYQFSAWGVSLNTNFGYDFIPVNTWDGIERSRTFLDLGVGVHYLIGR